MLFQLVLRDIIKILMFFLASYLNLAVSQSCFQEYLD